MGAKVIDIPALRRKVDAPVEEMFHIYPVLLIPSEKAGETIVIGCRKARAIIRWYEDIKAFHQRHQGDT